MGSNLGGPKFYIHVGCYGIRFLKKHYSQKPISNLPIFCLLYLFCPVFWDTRHLNIIMYRVLLDHLSFNFDRLIICKTVKYIDKLDYNSQLVLSFNTSKFGKLMTDQTVENINPYGMMLVFYPQKPNKTDGMIVGCYTPNSKYFIHIQDKNNLYLQSTQK